MQLIITRTAEKALRRMPGKDAAALIEKLKGYAQTGQGDVKKLVGQPYYRLRHGDWRAIFEIEGDVIVIRIAHRREVYE
ncbi:type II toxin-antitoxin system RelE/ParE family toxin [Cereibacter sp. SYSU M97828]|nr:type II toxin-antitoxin system RelE/ParE family toxin [Cereibacter flavus]